MDNYQSICQIGKGKFGSIFKIVRKSDSKIMVWKELDYSQMSEKEKQQIVSEVNILRELKHPNIVRYHDRVIDKKNLKIFIIMEYCEGGDLSQLIKRCKKSSQFVQEDCIWKILTQIIKAIHSCHNRIEGKVLHRDIKPSNIFLDNENNIKLGDFGLSRVLSNESNFAYSHVGTPYYMSPEQIEEMRYNEKSDIWSLGCFLYELTTLNPPFEATNHVSLALKIKAGKVEKINNRYSEELWRVITWMLSVDHHFRPSIDELLNLPQISLRLREKKVKDSFGKLKEFEESLKIREEMLNNKEKELDNREKNIKEKEEALNEREKILNDDYNSKRKLMESVSISLNSKSTTIAHSNNNNNSNNIINGNNGGSEDCDKSDANKYTEDRDSNSTNNIYYPKSVFNSIQNLDYYLPNANSNNINNRNVISSELCLNNHKQTTSFRFDPSLYNDNEYPSAKELVRYHSNHNVSIRNGSNSNRNINKKMIVDYQSRDKCITNYNEIKAKKVIITKRSSTAKKQNTTHNIQQQYSSNVDNNNTQNKKYTMNHKSNSNSNSNSYINAKRTNSVNSIIDTNNTMSSSYIKARQKSIPIR